MASDMVPSNGPGAGRAVAPISPLIERAVLDPAFDVAKLDAILALQARQEDRMARQDFNRAMTAAQQAMAPVVRDALNQHTKSRYAKLETISRQVKPIYTAHGFSVRYGSLTPTKPGNVRITCHVAHESGHEEPPLEFEAAFDLVGSQGKANKTEVQGLGSTVSYLRRYMLCLAFDIVLADDDDDGGEVVYTLDNTETDAQWLALLDRMLKAAATLDEVADVAGHRTVVAALQKAPTLIRRNVQDMLAAAHRRLAPQGEQAAGSAEGGTNPPAGTAAAGAPSQPQGEGAWADDPIAKMVEAVNTMTLHDLAGLATNARWRAQVRELFPPDEDRLTEVIEARRAYLKGRQDQ